MTERGARVPFFLGSVAVEEVRPEEWAENVYKPDILNKQEKLCRKPGYEPSCELKKRSCPNFCA
jgi:hypothetical protein